LARPLKAFFVDGQGRRAFDFTKGETLDKALLRLGYHPDALVVLVDGKPVAESDELKAGAEYRLVLVASGG